MVREQALLVQVLAHYWVPLAAETHPAVQHQVVAGPNAGGDYAWSSNRKGESPASRKDKNGGCTPKYIYIGVRFGSFPGTLYKTNWYTIAQGSRISEFIEEFRTAAILKVAQKSEGYFEVRERRAKCNNQCWTFRLEGHKKRNERGLDRFPP